MAKTEDIETTVARETKLKRDKMRQELMTTIGNIYGAMNDNKFLIKLRDATLLKAYRWVEKDETHYQLDYDNTELISEARSQIQEKADELEDAGEGEELAAIYRKIIQRLTTELLKDDAMASSGDGDLTVAPSTSKELTTMGQTLDKAGKKIDIANVVHHGEKLILPSGMDIPGAIDLLKRRWQYLQEEVVIDETFDVFPWDGAYAFDKILRRRYGWAPATAVQTMFGPNPPKMITIATGPKLHDKASIPWGKFELPNVKGEIHTTTGEKDGRVCFRLYAKVKREGEEAIHALCEDLRQELVMHSIYRGQAIKLRFRDDHGNALEMPEPKFLETDHISREMLIFPQDVQQAVETNLFTPIERVEDCINNGITVKRGVLLGGTFGTGKTLAATVASRIAVDNGVTFVYITHADELGDAINFSKQYQSPACVIFCEDIDRSMSGERSVEMDQILNTIDGVDSKHSHVIVVLTTNDLEAINPAMLRPGRLDAVIDVLPPDAKAVEKLLRYYGGPSIEADADLSEAGQALNGAIPAVIAEVVKRAKLSQLKRQPKGEPVTKISGAALVEAAKTMEMQIRLLKERSEAKPEHTTIDDLVSNAISKELKGEMDNVTSSMTAIKKAMGVK